MNLSQVLPQTSFGGRLRPAILGLLFGASTISLSSKLMTPPGEESLELCVCQACGS